MAVLMAEAMVVLVAMVCSDNTEAAGYHDGHSGTLSVQIYLCVRLS